MLPQPEICDRESALQWLLGRIDYERRMDVPYTERSFKLDRMRTLAAGLGNPHHQLRIVHVAGSKGKGSTASMVSTVLTAAGFRTGRFTSPHLLNLEERICINGTPVSTNQLIALIRRVSLVVSELDQKAISTNSDLAPTFFEVVTALALLHFHQERVDMAVLEVGLGGRLDSTNICNPAVSAITSIGLDHTRQLGKTLEAIAAEKGGIIKPGVPVVIGADQPRVQDVLTSIAADRGCETYVLHRDFEVTHRMPEPASALETLETFDFSWKHARLKTPPQQLRHLQVSLLGRHQVHNAAVTVAIIHLLAEQGMTISESHLRTGLLHTKCPGRVERIGHSPIAILDVAHNSAAIAALVQSIDSHFPVPRAKRTVIFAGTKGKDIHEMLQQLIDWAGEIVLTQYLDNPRGVTTAEVTAIAEKIAASSCTPATLLSAHTPKDAWHLARQHADKDRLVCITGSFFLAAELAPMVRQHHES